LRISQTYQTHKALHDLRALGIADHLESAICGSNIRLERGNGAAVKGAIEFELESLGWMIPMRIDGDLRAEVNAFHPKGVALQVQMGNVARAFYDLMKLQRLFELKKISVGVLVVPMRSAALKVGSNLANFERITEEHELMFQTQITSPLVVFGIS
jgi:hypothetical protein